MIVGVTSLCRHKDKQQKTESKGNYPAGMSDRSDHSPDAIEFPLAAQAFGRQPAHRFTPQPRRTGSLYQSLRRRKLAKGNTRRPSAAREP